LASRSKIFRLVVTKNTARKNNSARRTKVRCSIARYIVRRSIAGQRNMYSVAVGQQQIKILNKKRIGTS